MKLRNGKIYHWVKPIDVTQVITIQSVARGYIVKTKFNKILNAIHILHKQAPHLYKYKPRKKKIKIKQEEEEFGDFAFNYCRNNK